jgi:hypothetical protein
MAIPSSCGRASEAAALAGSALEPGLDWVASTFSIAALLSEMKESTQRISELVAAIKSYSQVDRASMQQIDVTDGIDSALVMLGHKRRPGIAVVRDYSASLPRIQAYPGELNQVWTNLIDNALDAMNGTGTLKLAARVEEQDIVVEVGDTGPGMPPQVASRAFDAFYTTKDAGKGTGLGLDIARRTVVERHGGLITIDSQPGNTVLRRMSNCPSLRNSEQPPSALVMAICLGFRCSSTGVPMTTITCSAVATIAGSAEATRRPAPSTRLSASSAPGSAKGIWPELTVATAASLTS